MMHPSHRTVLTTLLIILYVTHQGALSFSQLPVKSRELGNFALFAGMGMASKETRKKKNSRKAKAPSGMKKSSFDVNASLLRLEKQYDELDRESAKSLEKDTQDRDDTLAREFIVAVRSSEPSSVLSDWVPIAQLIISRKYGESGDTHEGTADPMIPIAVSHFCRELACVATLGSRAFQSVPRQSMQYSVEPINSWMKYVYDVIIEGKNEDKSNEQVMMKDEARQVLELDGEQISLSEVKRAYRSKSMELHPDRLLECSEEEKLAASLQFAKVKLAYETLQSGVRDGSSSWYSTLGGKARTDFLGPLELISLGDAEKELEASTVKCAVAGLDADLVQSFVARLQAV